MKSKTIDVELPLKLSCTLGDGTKLTLVYVEHKPRTKAKTKNDKKRARVHARKNSKL